MRKGIYPKRIKKVCKICRKEFETYKSYNRVYCSVKCKVKDQKNFKSKTGIIKKCLTCGKEIYVQKGMINNKKFCSLSCKSKYPKNLEISIKNLNKVNRNRLKKENNPNWKGKNCNYRKYAFEKYPNKCIVCDSDKKLIAHHLNCNRENSEIENIRILCQNCHSLIHRYVEQRNNGNENKIKDLIKLLIGEKK